MTMTEEIRYYKGKFKCKILHKGRKKALVEWLESCNVVGNKEIGYKTVDSGDKDIICSMRMLNRNNKELIKTTTIYTINEDITLKLENNRTNIYIKGEIFNHCKYLLINLESKEIPEYDDFESMDEVFKYYSRKNEGTKSILTPKQEFIGHCSNLQVWVENDYNVDILHTKLSFPLLTRLSYLGDNKARIVLKEVIAERLLSKNKNTIIFFLETDYLHLFEIEELEFLFEEVGIEDQETLQKINKLMNSKRIINSSKNRKHQKIELEKRGWGGY